MMEDKKTKEVLDFILSAYRARLAIQDTSDNCPFDFKAYLGAWKRLSWDQLKRVIRDNLETLLHEGIFDSILPYLLQSFPTRKLPQNPKVGGGVGKDVLCGEPGGASSKALANIHGSIAELSLSKTRERRKSGKEKGVKGDKDSDDCDIVIHVCDEMKGIREDFHCRQSILTMGMGYFSHVTVKGQKLRDMDISVHCDITVFDWLMKWIHHRANDAISPPTLEATNVIGLAVSADFLQMSQLVSECLQFTSDNIEKVILYSPNLGCLSEGLIGRLGAHFHNVDIEKRIVPIDRNDRVTSRLYIQMILSLNDPEPDMGRGHYSSTSTLFKCNLCDQHLTNDYAPKSPCTSMRFDCRGRLYASHFKDPNWSLGSYIKELKRELKTWRKVYWRLWGTVHFFYCSCCQLYFPAKNIGTCLYHPEAPKLKQLHGKDGDKENFSSSGMSFLAAFDHQHLVMRKHFADFPERKRPSLAKSPHEDTPVTTDPSVPYLPYGSFPCCQEMSFSYTPLPHVKGCQLKDHVIDDCDNEDPNLSTTISYRDLIQDPNPALAKLDWGGIIQLVGEKPTPIPIVNLVPPEIKEVGPSPGTASRLTSSDSDSNFSESENEDDGPKRPPQPRLKSRPLPIDNSGKGWESWVWNNDLTTRYNQDMQREREEKLMMDLACLLSQRVPLDPTIGYTSTKYGFLNRRLCKENVGGSYVRIDQNWREQHQLALSKGHKNKVQKIS